MKYLDEYRDPAKVKSLLAEIRRTVTRPWSLMEICGGQTHSIMRHGLDELLPPKDRVDPRAGLPGVRHAARTDRQSDRDCLTPRCDLHLLRRYAARARLRTRTCSARAADGGDVRVVYSPLDAVKIAQQNPDKQVVFFGIGFETTAPANAMSVWQAKQTRRQELLDAGVARARAAGHARDLVLAVQSGAGISGGGSRLRGDGLLGISADCRENIKMPIVVTGFEPVDLVEGILKTVQQLEANRHEVENAYGRAVTLEGNQPAQDLINKVFVECDRKWRGIGMIPLSGWRLRDEFADFDAEKRFDVGEINTKESPLCITGQVLQGRKKPMNAPPSAKNARPDIRSARRWFPAKARARRIIVIGRITSRPRIQTVYNHSMHGHNQSAR